MSDIYVSTLLKCSNDVVPIILGKLEKDSKFVNEVHLSLLQQLMPRFQFKHADRLVYILEIVKNQHLKSDGNIIKHSNPIMNLVIMIDLMQKMREQFSSLALRIDFINETILDKFTAIYTNTTNPQKMKILVKQQDFRGISVLQYLSKMQVFKFLQINHVTRIAGGMWWSTTDVNGSMFQQATCYDLAFNSDLKHYEDNEIHKRFYRLQQADRPMTHQFNIKVWQKSMGLRYLIEATFFFMLMFVFQYEISLFNKDLHIAIHEIELWKELKHELERRNLPSYRDLHYDDSYLRGMSSDEEEYHSDDSHTVDANSKSSDGTSSHGTNYSLFTDAQIRK